MSHELKTISIRVAKPVWRVFSEVATASGKTIPEWLETVARDDQSVIAVAAKLRKHLPAMRKTEPVNLFEKGSLHPERGATPMQIVAILTETGGLSWGEIVDRIEPNVKEHTKRRTIRNAILRLCRTGTLSMDESRVVRLAKARK